MLCKYKHTDKGGENSESLFDTELAIAIYDK